MLCSNAQRAPSPGTGKLPPNIVIVTHHFPTSLSCPDPYSECVTWLSPSLRYYLRSHTKEVWAGSPRTPELVSLITQWTADSEPRDLRPWGLRPLSKANNNSEMKTEYYFSSLFWDPLCWHSFKAVFSWISEAKSPFRFKSLKLNIGFPKDWWQFLQFTPKSLTWISTARVILVHQQNLCPGKRRSVLVLWLLRDLQEEISSPQPTPWLRAKLLLE